MVYSDYYRVIMNITGSNNTKHYVEFAKAWLNDKDIDEGKMWYYYIYVMCDHIREAEMECYEEKMSKYEDVQAGDLQVNFRYLIYYNKCNNTYQLVNAYPANIAAPGA